MQLGHPDAYAALSNAKHEVHNHFSIPPFTFLELKNVPGAHVVLSSPDVMGGPLSQAQFFTTTNSPTPTRKSSRPCAMPPRKRRI